MTRGRAAGRLIYRDQSKYVETEQAAAKEDPQI
jgi:hypothetical protein